MNLQQVSKTNLSSFGKQTIACHDQFINLAAMARHATLCAELQKTFETPHVSTIQYVKLDLAEYCTDIGEQFRKRNIEVGEVVQAGETSRPPQTFRFNEPA